MVRYMLNSVEKTNLPGVFIINSEPIADKRGFFVKIFQRPYFNTIGVSLALEEEFYSLSYKNVLRGMHFQVPPFEHDKIVTCLVGAALDVVVDLRPGDNFGNCFSVLLSEENCKSVFLPKGVAHGFLSQANKTIMLYKTNAVYSLQHDSGIRWDSFGFDWPANDIIVSERDQSFVCLSEFLTPF